MSRSITSAMSGRWTFTTTASPERSRAAVGLTDRCRRERFPLEAREHLTRLAVELTVEHRLHPIDRFGCSAVLQQRELVADFGRKQIDSGGRDLSELHVYPAGRFEHAPQPHAFGHRRAFLAGVRIEERAETLSSQRCRTSSR